jgi:tetratricopeptide (TPR) repeat protein
MSKNQIELAVLAVRDSAANCKILKTNEKIILRLSSYQLFKIVSGEIATIDPKKQWEFGNNKYISGKLIDHRIDIPALGLIPLKLEKFDYWDPLEAFEEERNEYDEIIEETDEYYKAIIQAGKRPCYEMEQIVPGDTDLDADGPILDAIYYKDIGEVGKGQDILMDEIIMDIRCLDAHAHLGNFIFDSRPEKAILHYNVGMKIGELSLPEDFNEVLLWAELNNRPFFRCLHGYGLCLWRLGRFKEAEKVFERMLWLNPPDNQGARFNIYLVKDKKPWREDY